MPSELADLIDGTPGRFVPDEMHGRLVEAEHLTRYQWASFVASRRRVLDAGCGIGYGAVMLADAGAAAVTAVDIADDVIHAAHSNASSVDFCVADVRSLPFEDAAFDLVTCFEVIEHLDRQQEALDEMKRVLAPGGVLLISSPNRGVYVPGNPHHLHEYTAEELRSALSERWTTVSLLQQHNFVASTILPSSDSRTAGPRGNLPVHQLVQKGPGEETYTIAAATNGSLPDITPLLTLAAPIEIEEWVKRFAAQQQLLEEQATALEAACRSVEDRSNLLVELVQSETVLADVQSELRSAEEENRELITRSADLTEQLSAAAKAIRDIEGSVSWKITRPLRSGKRAIRALKRSA